MTIKLSCLFTAIVLAGCLASTSSLTAQSAPMWSNTDVLTWHNINSRWGVTFGETLLTPANVNGQQFGKVGFFGADGIVDAQPLYVAGVKIAGNQRNVLYIATEHDTLYAKDAETGQTLWSARLLKSGESSSDDHGCSQITPEVGITATPVIDLGKGPHGAIYVVSMAKDSAGKYHQRLNSLDLATGAQLFGGPTEIFASYAGKGQNAINGKVVFDPAQYAERAALLEWNGGIYTTWTSHCDQTPYTGWIIAYDASTLKQTQVLNVTPNGGQGAIWMGAGGPAATSSQIFFLDGNGTFDATLDGNGFPTSHDFGNAFLELSQSAVGQLQVKDYYATDSTVQQSNNDIDLGSGGVILFPTIYDNSGNSHQLAVGAGKDSNIYVVDQTNLGKYHPNGGSIYQVLSGALPNGVYSAPAFFDNHLFYGGVQDNLQSFTFSDAKLGGTNATRSAYTFPYPGTTPSISSNNGKNGILWTISHANPSVLFAYNPFNLSQIYYRSSDSGSRDQFGSAGHFITPTIANGHVYVATNTGIAVFGLL